MVADSRSPGVTSSRGGAASPPKPADAEPLQLTPQATAQSRGLIIDRVLLPVEKILQVELAERIGVSRSPLREALRTLESEGVVAYEINRGYVVARLDDDDLGQIHRMRTLLEDELLRTVKRPDAAVLSDLKDPNEKMMVAIDERKRWIR
jgi:DNA-binding GntR family transcriptional regulator